MGSAVPTILIVDDEPINLTILTQVLSKQYQVRAASCGEQALKVAAMSPIPDMILLDIMMPDVNGYTVLARLKRDPVTQHIPVMFTTAMSASIDEEMGLKMGAVDYMTKPIVPAILLQRIKTHLLLKKTNDELQVANDKLTNSNVYLENEITERMKENIAVQNVTIRALAHLAETRDPETGNHILRTQSYVEILARRLQKHPDYAEVITDHFINLVTRSAPLHDIGKVGIPDHVLLKPGKLDADEWVIMKTHAELGEMAIILAEQDVDHPLEFLTLAKEIARWHHEKWDGSGYPDGLAGKAIPVSARLMAVADVFDALTSQRVYKKAMSFEQSRDIIIDGSGQHFDPDIVAIFIELYNDFVLISQKYSELDA